MCMFVRAHVCVCMRARTFTCMRMFVRVGGEESVCVSAKNGLNQIQIKAVLSEN